MDDDTTKIEEVITSTISYNYTPDVNENNILKADEELLSILVKDQDRKSTRLNSSH